MERGGERPEAVLVRVPVESGSEEAVGDLVLEIVRESAEVGVGAVLPQTDVSTVSVFLERGESREQEENGAALWWYVEVAGLDGPWTDPARAIRKSPLFDAGLSSFLDEGTQARVYGPGRHDSLQFVHAWLPDRPRRYRTGGDGLGKPDGEWQPRLVLAEDGPSDLPDVVLVRWRLRPGAPTWFVRWFARFADWTAAGGVVERLVRPSSEKAMAAENMWTESAFLAESDGSGGSTALLGFMECADMKGVTDGFYETDSRVARVSEHVLGWLFENPRQALEYEALETPFEPLVHAVSADRI